MAEEARLNHGRLSEARLSSPSPLMPKLILHVGRCVVKLLRCFGVTSNQEIVNTL